MIRSPNEPHALARLREAVGIEQPFVPVATHPIEKLCEPAILALFNVAESAKAKHPHLAKALIRLRQSTRKAMHAEMEREHKATLAKAQQAPRAAALFTLELPGVHTKNEGNTHEHWRKKHKERGDIRPTVAMMLRAHTSHARFAPPIPCVIRITRLGAKKLDPGGLASALKSTEDGCQDWIGVDDGNSLVTYAYEQEFPKAPGIRVEVFALGDVA